MYEVAVLEVEGASESGVRGLDVASASFVADSADEFVERYVVGVRCVVRDFWRLRREVWWWGSGSVR